MINDLPEYWAAIFALHLKAALDEPPAVIDYLEEPFLCEDGKTYNVRAIAIDDREYSTSYVPTEALNEPDDLSVSPMEPKREQPSSEDRDRNSHIDFINHQTPNTRSTPGVLEDAPGD